MLPDAATFDAADLRSALSRLVEATGAVAGPERVRDAALAAVALEQPEALGASEPTTRASDPAAGEALDPTHPGADARPAWSTVTARACDALGLQASFVRAAHADVLATAGPGRPLLTRTATGAPLVITDRRGASLRLVELESGEMRWMSAAEVASMAGGTEDSIGEWLAIDANLGSAGLGATHESVHGEGEHDEHPAPRDRLWRWMVLEREDLWTVLVYAAFVGVLGLTVPVAVQSLVNTVAFGTLLQPLVVLSLLLFGGLAFSAVLRGLQYWVVEVIQRRVLVRVVSDLAHRLPRVQAGALDGRDGAELANRFFDVVTIQKSASSLLLDGLEIALTVAVGMLVLAFYHPLLFALDVVLVLALTGVAWLGRGGPATAIGESREKYALAAWLEELARHDTTFKLGGGLDYAETRADALTHGWLEARKRHFHIVLRQVSVVLGLQALGSAGVLGIGGWLVIERQLTLGQLVAAEIIVTAVVAAMAKVGKYLESYYDLLAAVDKVGHLLDLPLEREGGAKLAPEGGRRGATLTADSVSGGYASGPALFDRASFALPSGARAALVGADGSGKSLLVEMVAALRAPRAGSIRIDGLDVRDAALVELRSRIAVVRGATVVPDTILENVRMGRAGIDAADVREALRAVGLEETVDALPEGLNTMLSATGRPLSHGARSRLAIARAIVARPALLVLDDALDGIDPKVRAHLYDRLFSPSQPWTLIVASDEEDVARRCDHVLRLEAGVIDCHVRRDSLVPTAPLPAGRAR